MIYLHFYFDIRKDSIYCDPLDSTQRRATRTVLDIIFNYLVRWLAPTLVFTCEEAWKSKGNTSSIHLENFLQTPIEYKNIELSKKWNTIKKYKKSYNWRFRKKTC